MESRFIEIRVLLHSTSLEEMLQVNFWAFLEQLPFRGALKSNQSSRMEIIGKILNAFNPFIYCFQKLYLICLTGFLIHLCFSTQQQCKQLRCYDVAHKGVINLWHKEVIQRFLTKMIHSSVNVFVANNNKTRALWD